MYSVLVSTPESDELFVRPFRYWEDNIKVYARKKGC